jgi:myo-inositol 2-dehydrogenase / D-chiro-inositol 1-dehydrogenase
MPSRRDFLQSTAAGAAALSFAPAVHAAGKEELRIGLVGCGGRGRGAAADALQADPSVKLVALCDIFPEIAKLAGEELSKKWNDRADLGQRLYSGFDGYKQLIDSGTCDMVLLASPPGFRPLHLDYAVKAGKHVFAEKPLAVDAPGVRSVIASAKLASEKNLLCASGFCYRHDARKIETVRRIKEGAIGSVVSMQVSYNTSFLWHRGDKPEWTPMEKQIRNWLYYTWLSGDHLVEQACHNIDKACWVMGEYPVACTGLGGRQVRTDPKWGNIWDHFSLVYEYASGRRVFAQCRQIGNCQGDVSDHIWGTDGKAELMSHRIQKASHNEWEYTGDYRDMYVQEHVDFIQSIKAGKPINDMESAAQSTLMAILGRQAAYTGKRILWKQMLNSQESLSPANYAFGNNPVPPVAMPGQTKFA